MLHQLTEKYIPDIQQKRALQERGYQKMSNKYLKVATKFL